MTAAVLDASALLALILGEPGGEKVKGVLTDCAMTAVNLGEVVGHFARIGSPEADIRLMLDPLPFVRVALDEELAFIAGLMLPATRPAGLSFGDRACLALANRLGVRALTADRASQCIGRAVGVEIEFIRADAH
jgi:ribonuclease VapC